MLFSAVSLSVTLAAGVYTGIGVGAGRGRGARRTPGGRTPAPKVALERTENLERERDISRFRFFRREAGQLFRVLY